MQRIKLDRVYSSKTALFGAGLTIVFCTYSSSPLYLFCSIKAALIEVHGHPINPIKALPHIPQPATYMTENY
jgi:hypothetical protein